MIQYASQNIENNVSVLPSIFKASGNLAKQLGISLTDFYTLALTSYMTKFNENITDPLDCIYKKNHLQLTPFLQMPNQWL